MLKKNMPHIRAAKSDKARLSYYQDRLAFAEHRLEVCKTDKQKRRYQRLVPYYKAQIESLKSKAA